MIAHRCNFELVLKLWSCYCLMVITKKMSNQPNVKFCVELHNQRKYSSVTHVIICLPIVSSDGKKLIGRIEIQCIKKVEKMCKSYFMRHVLEYPIYVFQVCTVLNRFECNICSAVRWISMNFRFNFESNMLWLKWKKKL